MDFMDDDMKQIAISKFYGTEGSVYAACEAVLAEQKRREAQQEIDATVRHPAQQASLGELTPDELSRFRQRLNVPAELVRQQPAEDVVRRSWNVWNMTGQESTRLDELEESDRARWTAALAVAREGMYSLEQVEKAIFTELKQHNHLWSNTLFWEAVRALLTAKQQPTERVTVQYVSAADTFGWKVFLDHCENGLFTCAADAERYAAALRAELAALSEGRQVR